MSRAYVGVGANLGDARAAVARALDDLGALSGSPARISSLYRTEPLGPPDQPWYVNAVAEIDTPLEPLELLRALRELERSAGRDRSKGTPWGPRELDLDLLLVGDRVLDTAELVLPHPGLAASRWPSSLRACEIRARAGRRRSCWWPLTILSGWRNYRLRRPVPDRFPLPGARRRRLA